MISDHNSVRYQLKNMAISDIDSCKFCQATSKSPSHHILCKCEIICRIRHHTSNEHVITPGTTTIKEGDSVDENPKAGQLRTWTIIGVFGRGTACAQGSVYVYGDFHIEFIIVVIEQPLTRIPGSMVLAIKYKISYFSSKAK